MKQTKVFRVKIARSSFHHKTQKAAFRFIPYQRCEQPRFCPLVRKLVWKSTLLIHLCVGVLSAKTPEVHPVLGETLACATISPQLYILCSSRVLPVRGPSSSNTLRSTQCWARWWCVQPLPHSRMYCVRVECCLFVW